MVLTPYCNQTTIMAALNCRSTPIHFVNLKSKKSVLIAYVSPELWMKMMMIDCRQHKTKPLKMCPRRFSWLAFQLLLLRTSQTASRHPPCRPWATMYSLIHLIKCNKTRRSQTKYQIRVNNYKRFGRNVVKLWRRGIKKTQPGHGMTSKSTNQPWNGVTSESDDIAQTAFRD